MNKMPQDFGLYSTVNVTHRPGDYFDHDFTGTVVGYHGEYLTVQDQNDNCWDCLPGQVETNFEECDEQQRRDEKNGLYGEYVDPAN